MVGEIKKYLKITWDDENGDIQDMISRGESHLKGLTDTELDCEIDGLAKSLLFDYCRYAYNNALEYFEENFSKEILRLQLQEAVKANEI